MHRTFHRLLLMRFRLLLSPLCAVLLGSCAYQGTIVQKDAAPSPFNLSYGVDGSYAFLLRDSTGATRRQIVTAEVYNEYAVGEYFNDLQPRRASDAKSFDGKTVMTAMMSKVTTRRTVVARKPEQQKTKVAKAAKSKKSDVKLVKQSRPAVKMQQPTRVAAAVAQPRKALPVDQPFALQQRILRQQPVWENDLAYVSFPRCR